MSKHALTDLKGLIRFTILKAPDRFPADTGMTLDRVFVKLDRSLEEAAQVLGHVKTNQFRLHLENALQHYHSHNVRAAIAELQLDDNMI